MIVKLIRINSKGKEGVHIGQKYERKMFIFSVHTKKLARSYNHDY